MDWHDENIARLRQFWAEGHSTAEIGRRMGVSKNAVVGKAHRLDLPARPSPIRRAVSGMSAPRPAVPRRVTGPTLPALASAPPAHPGPPSATPAPATPALATLAPATLAVVRSVESASPRPAAPPALRAVAARSPRSVPCCWPIGEPGTKSFRFCDADAVSGKPYCPEHAQVAYVKVRDRREEAA